MTAIGRLALPAIALSICVAACGGDDDSSAPTSVTTVAVTTSVDFESIERGPGGEWIDEPLPVLEELQNPASCEDFMKMLIGVENERFRLKTDVTAADDEANNYTHWDFNELDLFADLQADIGCGDGEFFTRVDNAYLARCDRWFAQAHHPDEEPLMLNTDQCL